jgi:hypothetical protein
MIQLHVVGDCRSRRYGSQQKLTASGKGGAVGGRSLDMAKAVWNGFRGADQEPDYAPEREEIQCRTKSKHTTW